MNISFYKKWVEEFSFAKLNFDSLSTFDDLMVLSFKVVGQVGEKKPPNSKRILNIFISLNGDSSLIFWSEDEHFFQTLNLKQLSAYNTHLNHSSLRECRLINDDKIITFRFTKWNIYNEEENLCLTVEMIPRYQNLILATQRNEKQIILECQKKITFSDNNTRQILPGSEYTPPNTSYQHTETPLVYPLQIEKESFNSVNDYFSYYYHNVLLQKKVDTQKKSLLASVDKELKKAMNKLAKQTVELQTANEIERWYQCVELLKPSLFHIKTGAESLSVVNYFDPDMPNIEIKLNPELSPQKNLEHYVKKYKKAFSGQKMIAENIKKTNSDIDRFRDAKNEIEQIDDYARLKAYNSQLNTADGDGWLKKIKQKQMFRTLTISNDWVINIGRSKKENELLTCRTANPEDWWFHTRIYQGAHVVLRNYKKEKPDPELVVLCARLAAHYSRAKNSSNVPVDYTKIRYITKPRGAATGYVIYKNQKTIYVDPIDFREAVKLVQEKSLTPNSPPYKEEPSV